MWEPRGEVSGFQRLRTRGTCVFPVSDLCFTRVCVCPAPDVFVCPVCDLVLITSVACMSHSQKKIHWWAEVMDDAWKLYNCVCFLNSYQIVYKRWVIWVWLHKYRRLGVKRRQQVTDGVSGAILTLLVTRWQACEGELFNTVAECGKPQPCPSSSLKLMFVQTPSAPIELQTIYPL